MTSKGIASWPAVLCLFGHSETSGLKSFFWPG